MKSGELKKRCRRRMQKRKKSWRMPDRMGLKKEEEE